MKCIIVKGQKCKKLQRKNVVMLEQTNAKHTFLNLDLQIKTFVEFNVADLNIKNLWRQIKIKHTSGSFIPLLKLEMHSVSIS